MTTDSPLILRLRLALAWAMLASIAPASAADAPPATVAKAAAPEEVARGLLDGLWPAHPEPVDMLADIVIKGDRIGGGDGWFRKAVAQTRFDWMSVRAMLDKDNDGSVSRAEFPGSDADFARVDRDRNGSLNEPDFDFASRASVPSPGAMIFARADRDSNGKVTREELDAYFKAMDSDGLGFLSQADLLQAFAPPAGPNATPTASNGPSRATFLHSFFREELGAFTPGPALNAMAPDFTLRPVDGSSEITLSKSIGPKPVVLIFGNFTCGPFRGQAGNLEKLQRRYKDRATFLIVYVREAHPTDGWRMVNNDRAGVSIRQPRSDAERVEVARTCSRSLGFGFPMLVDTIDDRVNHLYSGIPSRLYLIDGDGKVAYKSGRGPFGFRPAELEQSLVLLLQQPGQPSGKPVVERLGQVRAQGPARERPLRMLSDEDAWGRLPKVAEGGHPALPNWARATASSLPRTTAAMIDLDRIHRTRSPLDPILRGEMRWVAADANRCDYARQTAELDLRRAGMKDDAIAALKNGKDAWPEADRAAMIFASHMTLDAGAVTDGEVRRLKDAYGESKLVAMVQLLAAANFQDRLLLSLGTPIEDGGPLAPLSVRFDKTSTPPVPPRDDPAKRSGPPVPTTVNDPEWTAQVFDDLQKGLSAQRANEGRIRVPTFEEVLANLPVGAPPPKNPIRIKWSLVCMGYQPELAMAWSACTNAFREEAKQDRVFEESQFWVVTRTIHCFY